MYTLDHCSPIRPVCSGCRSASKIGSSTSIAVVCATPSRMQGMVGIFRVASSGPAVPGTVGKFLLSGPAPQAPHLALRYPLFRPLRKLPHYGEASRFSGLRTMFAVAGGSTVPGWPGSTPETGPSRGRGDVRKRYEPGAWQAPSEATASTLSRRARVAHVCRAAMTVLATISIWRSAKCGSRRCGQDRTGRPLPAEAWDGDSFNPVGNGTAAGRGGVPRRNRQLSGTAGRCRHDRTEAGSPKLRRRRCQ